MNGPSAPSRTRSRRRLRRRPRFPWSVGPVSLLLGGAILAAGCAPADSEPFDLVVAEGRVMDPESGLDAVRWIGIREGRIAAIAEGPLEGRQVLDAAGLVVAPGFIDLHAHGQDDENYRLFALNGVTTALEMEVGTGEVAAWYAERAEGTLIHHGVTIGHIPTRMALFQDPGTFLPSGFGGYRVATEEEIALIRSEIRRGLEEGALGVGMGIQYTPAATRWEVLEVCREAAAHRAPVFVHSRGFGLQEPGGSVSTPSPPSPATGGFAGGSATPAPQGAMPGCWATTYESEAAWG